MTATGADAYLWQPTGSIRAVRIRFDVIQKLNVEIVRGMGVIPKRGAEVGGFLLGQRDSAAATLITDFVPVPCHYAQGPSYWLSEEDLKEFDRLLEQRRENGESQVVGIYRSHTREGLEPDARDEELFDRAELSEDGLLLLVRPAAMRAGTGGFFFREGGKLQSATLGEFPFRGRELGQAPARRVTRVTLPPQPSGTAPENGDDSPAVAAEAAILPADLRPEGPAADRVEDTPMFAQFHEAPSRWKVWASWVLFCLLLLAAGAFAGWQYGQGQWFGNASAGTTDPYELGLRIERADDNLVVRWNRDTPAARHGWRGILTITEEAERREVQLDGPLLQSGSVLYRNVAPKVDFRLEIFLRENRSIAESQAWRAD